ncbi:uncharacterized protein LOC141913135 [Tubulanus polymorphus]|uniref:uncharacterized protein LOC141913135 n=1 Tax=Tubulanus polymorphus TaxID=672921 RepID=UPI003DA6C1D0
MGVLQNVKRFAGASIGAVVSMMCSIGMTPEEIIEQFLFNTDYMQDAPKVAMVVNILHNWGWFHGERGVEIMEKLVEQKTGDRKTTFQQLYKKFGVELCILVTNVTHGTPEYFHVKTTPHVSIAYASIVSCSLPPLCKPSFYRGAYYVDGGMLNNFPINAFDGWYLSLDPDKDYFKMFDKNIEPFGTINKKTFGLLLFDIDEEEDGKEEFFDKWKYEWPKLPDTKLARKRTEETTLKREHHVKNAKLAGAVRRMVKSLCASDANDDGFIDADELETFFKTDASLSDDDFHLLFGVNRNQTDTIMGAFDRNHDNLISHQEIMAFIGSYGFTMNNFIMGGAFDAVNPSSFTEYLSSLLDALCGRIKTLAKKPEDKKRSACLYTSYIKTADMHLDMEDKIFCMKLGWMSILHHFDTDSF